ncbi:hypothetical protein PoB_007353800, partial [Plakobranchus ocellatus]
MKVIIELEDTTPRPKGLDTTLTTSSLLSGKEQVPRQLEAASGITPKDTCYSSGGSSGEGNTSNIADKHIVTGTQQNNLGDTDSAKQKQEKLSMGKNTECKNFCEDGDVRGRNEGPQSKMAPKVLKADVDDITSAIKACSLSSNKSLTSQGGVCNCDEETIVRQIQNLALTEKERQEKQRKPPFEPQGPDEKGKGFVDQKGRSSTNDLDESESKENEDQEDSSELYERGGPDGGIPAMHRYNNYHPGMVCPPLPASFPNYSNNTTVGFSGNDSGSKRTMDQSEMFNTCEPYKYHRPQQQQQQQQENIFLNNIINAGEATAQQGVRTVYQKQMSGGTVYAPPKPQPSEGSSVGFSAFHNLKPQDQALNGYPGVDFSGLPIFSVEDVQKVTGEATEDDDPTLFLPQDGRLPPVSTFFSNSLTGTAQDPRFMQQQPQQQPQQQQAGMENHKAASNNVESSPFTERENSLDFLDFCLAEEFIGFPDGTNPGMKNPITMALSSSGPNPSAQSMSTLPPVSTLMSNQPLTAPAQVNKVLAMPPFMQQQQQQQQLQQSDAVKRSSFGSNEDDHGYGSDTSPLHETQMEKSPAGSSQYSMALSPPRSNMSVSTMDSALGSPMSEDGNSQAKSPRNVNSPFQAVFSPLSQPGGHMQNCARPQVSLSSSLPPQPPAMLNGPYQNDSTLFFPQNGPQQGLLPHQGLGSMAGLGRLPYSENYQPQVVQSPPTDPYTYIMPQEPVMDKGPVAVSPPCPEIASNPSVMPLTPLSPSIQSQMPEEVKPYHSSYLDNKYEELSDILAVMDKDLTEQRQVLRKKSPSGSSPASSDQQRPPQNVLNEMSVPQPHTFSPGVITAQQNVPNEARLPQPQTVCAYERPAPLMSTNLECSAAEMPSLPTTVPTTIHSNGLPISQGKPKGKETAKPILPGPNVALGQTSAHPNKVPIPRKPGVQQQQKQLQQQSQIVLVNLNQGTNVLVPVTFAPPINAVQRPRFPNIAPKPAATVNTNSAASAVHSSRGLEKTASAGNMTSLPANSSSSPSTTVTQSNQNGTTARPPACPAGKSSVVDSIPSAYLYKTRRIIADWSTEKLLEMDHEGDNCLHNATAKTSMRNNMTYLVVAILERLARQDLLKAVNAQNMSGQ